MNLPNVQPPHHPQLSEQRIAELADHLRRELRSGPARSRRWGSATFRPRARIVAGAAVALVVAAIIGSSSAPATELPPIVDQIAAFRDPALQGSEIPPPVNREQERLSGSRGHGETIPGEVRLLAGELGATQSDIYAFPTQDAVCLVVLDGTALSTCVQRFDDRRGNLSWMIYSGPNHRPTVAGLISNRVDAVGIVANGAEHPALLGNNTFYWQAPDRVTRAAITTILAYQHDGSIVKIDVNLD
jgi:hypothetical protein